MILPIAQHQENISIDGKQIHSASLFVLCQF